MSEIGYPRQVTTWRVRSVCDLDVPQASGVTCVGGGRFLVVDDDHGVYLAREDGSSELVAARDDHPALRDLEGICVGPDGDAWVLSERTSAVLALPIERDGDAISVGAPRLVGEVEHVAKKKNKGWEGIALWPGDPPRVIACHEAKPRRVGVFGADLSTVAFLELPASLEDELEDLSDLTVDPETGHLLLLSDESAAVAEVAVRFARGVPAALERVSLTRLDLGKKEKPEGLCFDEHGTLWLVTDGRPHLYAFTRAG